MNRFKKIYGFALLLAFILAAVLPFGAVWAQEEQSAEEETWDYEQDFTDVDAINSDFNAYYLTAFMGTLTAETVKDESDGYSHFVAEGGVLRRENDIGLEYNADSIAMLYFSKQKYANFKMQIDMRQGDATTFWTGFCMRTPTLGKHHFEEGESFYVEWNGNVKTWGNGFHGGPFQCGVIPAYSQTEWYTYVVTVDGNNMTIDARPSGAPEREATSITVRIPWNFYQEGYVSLLSINNNSMFRNFKIKALPDTENIGTDVPADQQKPAASGDDSLDNMISNSDQSGPVQDVPAPEPIQDGKGWIWIIVGVCAAFVVGGVVAFFVVNKYKKKKAAAQNHDEEERTE